MHGEGKVWGFLFPIVTIGNSHCSAASLPILRSAGVCVVTLQLLHKQPLIIAQLFEKLYAKTSWRTTLTAVTDRSCARYITFSII